jgi:hypothetical protein
MIDKFFIILILMIIIFSVSALVARIEDKNNKQRIEDGNLSADDFTILE